MQISAINIDKFKRLLSLEIALSDITVLIGGNNSGKSSLLQGIHLAITTLQSARSATNKAQPRARLGSTSSFTSRPISPSALIIRRI
jgi:predicted ATP-dependent endonuclease of OLD family